MVVVVMGVSGVGKSTVGRLLAERLGFAFAEGDEYHPAANVAKMRAGIPLDDADRLPWLQTMAAEIDQWIAHKRQVVLACSTLKRRYRETLIGSRRGVQLVYLRGSQPLIQQRLRQRRGHYMPESLLASQLAALEEPETDEHPIVIDVDAAPEPLAERLVKQLGIAPVPRD